MSDSPVSLPSAPNSNVWEKLALCVAIAMLLGSLYMSIGMGLKACPLCLYERTFVMGLVGLLGVGITVRLADRPGSLSLLSLPLAVGGLGLAAFHVYLDRWGVLDCPEGVLGIGNAPDQSLAGYVLLTGLVSLGVLGSRMEPVRRYAGGLGGLLLGVALAVASVTSAPPLPPPHPTFGPSGERILLGCEPALPPGFQRPTDSGQKERLQPSEAAPEVRN